MTADGFGVSGGGEIGGTVEVSLKTEGETELYENHRCAAGCTDGLVLLKADGPSQGSGVIRIMLSGSAKYGIDYSIRNLELFTSTHWWDGDNFFFIDEISGGSHRDYVISPHNNAIPGDGTREVVMTIIETPEGDSGGGTSGPNYTIGNNIATFTIKDDDDWTINGSVTDAIALEPCAVSFEEYSGCSRSRRADPTIRIRVTISRSSSLWTARQGRRTGVNPTIN